jgi:nucleotide-binding universal stress UspA family protein
MNDQRWMKILIAYDGSGCAEAALDDLLRAGLPRQAEATVLTIAEELIPAPASFGAVDTTFPQAEFAAQRRALELARQTCGRLQALFPEWELRAEAYLGTPGSTLIARADEWQPDLLVVGSHGRTALGRFFFGSVSQKVVNEARCSVRVARGRIVTPSDMPVRLVVGVDGSAGAAAAIAEIAARAWPLGSEVRVVNAAWTIPPVAEAEAVGRAIAWIAKENARVRKLVDKAADKLIEAGLRVSTVVREQEPKSLLCAEAESLRADCIFVGAQGLGRLKRVLIGSVSAGVAARAHCSVELVRN